MKGGIYSMANTRASIGEQATLDGLIKRTLTSFEEDGVTTLRNYAFYKNHTIKNITLPSLTSTGQYAFSGCDLLNEINLPVLTNVGQYAFQDCKALNEIDLSLVTTLGNYPFENSGIGKIVLPVCASFGTYIGKGNRMSVIDISKSFTLAANRFNGATALCHLILRSETLCTLSNVNAFTGTGIAAGKGWIYVPSDLVDTYKAASNWSTYATQIVAISEYPKALQDETIADSWSDIIAACNDGTYSSKYNVGDIKYLNVGNTSLAMQIVAKDTDTLVSGGTAPLTWISVGLLEAMQMNYSDITTNGWEGCLVRPYLRDIIYPQIDSVVRNAIKTVAKTYYDVTTSSTKTVNDTVWIPSAREIFGGNSYENSGVDYTSLFSNATSRIKKYGIGGSAAFWWLRSANGATSFRIVNYNGSVNNNSASISGGVALGFCT